MRLLHAKTYTFKEFLGSKNIPNYAIVSHRWGEDEISHQEFLDGKRGGYGWTKIIQACRIATDKSLEWIWIDTICIDKKSSAELSEAINSMYKWYKKAEECYVFLNDVWDISECGCTKHLDRDTSSKTVAEPQMCSNQFDQSSWFTRGWTLQELLAPKAVVFYNARFRYIGKKNDLDLLERISTITRIGIPHLVGNWKINGPSIAQRMSWASRRQTTREEDMAYCLLGLFDVNIPLLYGEGDKAFVRLQTEIISRSTDESIFAWWLPGLNPQSAEFGVLAPTPLAFLESANITSQSYERRSHYEITNKGLRFPISYDDDVVAQLITHNDQFFGGWVKLVIPLNCRRSLKAGPNGTEMWQQIAIRAVATIEMPDLFNRSTYRLHGSSRETSLYHYANKPDPDGEIWDRLLEEAGFDHTGLQDPAIVVKAGGRGGTETSLYFNLLQY